MTRRGSGSRLPRVWYGSWTRSFRAQNGNLGRVARYQLEQEKQGTGLAWGKKIVFYDYTYTYVSRPYHAEVFEIEIPKHIPLYGRKRKRKETHAVVPTSLVIGGDQHDQLQTQRGKLPRKH